MTAKIEAGTAWTVIFHDYTGEKQVPAGGEPQPIAIDPFNSKPKKVTLTYGEGHSCRSYSL